MHSVPALILPADGSIANQPQEANEAPYLPQLIASMGAAAAEAFITFFAANIRNPNTRRAYLMAAKKFLFWLEAHGVARLTDVRPFHVAAYIEQLTTTHKPASVKLSLSAVRMLCDFLVTEQIIPHNPTAGVKAPRLSRTTGATPILTTGEASKLLAAIGTSEPRDLRDRAMIATMLYTFARIGAVLQIRRQDYAPNYGRMVLTLNEKGGKKHQMPVSRNLAPILDAWIEAGGIVSPEAYLFTSLETPDKPLTQARAFRIVRGHAESAGIATKVGNHSMRGTGITAYLLNGGTIERAQAMAAHADPRTTRGYDRRSIEQLVDDVERIAF
jgi:site-specific recombinase XerD